MLSNGMEETVKMAFCVFQGIVQHSTEENEENRRLPNTNKILNDE